ncbi:MAG: DUF2470 domain-containing protein [Chloroflexota bacterium]
MTTLHDELQQAAPDMIAHVNDDHADAMLKLVHAFGGQDWATDARLTAITPEGMTLQAIGDVREETVEVNFDPPLAKANHARRAMIHLIQQADAMLGNHEAIGRSLALPADVQSYLRAVSVRESDAARDLREAVAREPQIGMQIDPEQGQFLSLLLRLINAQRTIEVGVLMGYSTLWTALTLPEDGQVIACDVNEEWTNIGRPYWEAAGVAHKIDLRIAPAAETLQALLDDGQAGQFDFAFIDADKENYDTYYEQCLQLLREGGLIAIDNVLWGGRTADDTYHDDDTLALRQLNAKLHTDKRVDLSMLGIGDGLTLAYKR